MPASGRDRDPLPVQPRRGRLHRGLRARPYGYAYLRLRLRLRLRRGEIVHVPTMVYLRIFTVVRVLPVALILALGFALQPYWDASDRAQLVGLLALAGVVDVLVQRKDVVVG